MRDSMRPAAMGWLALPIAVYLFVLQRLWFNAPVWDDYDAILVSVMRLQDAASVKDFLAVLTAQHNEHRIFVMRFVSWLQVEAFGRIDFRALMLIGNFTAIGIFILMWTQFRQSVQAPLFAAAGFVMLQWTYYEASVMASAALPNIGVVFFSFACLAFALRPGRANVVAAMVFGILAVGSQANGLFALPLAAAACALTKSPRRASAYAALAAALWIAYFSTYHSTPGHPPITAALTNPLTAAQLFFVIVGGIGPGRWGALVVGLAIFGALAWLAWKGEWRRRPVVWLWILFVLASAGAAMIGRTGFGVYNASRYAIYSSSLLALILLMFCARTGPWKRSAIAAAVVLCAAGSLSYSWLLRDAIDSNVYHGHLLSKPRPAPQDDIPAPYVGTHYPHASIATQVLEDAEKRGIYRPAVVELHAFTTRVLALPPVEPARGGNVDQVAVSGKRLVVSGWSHAPAWLAHRSLSVYPPTGIEGFGKISNVPRPDVVAVFRKPALMYTGFRAEIDYATEDLARDAAATICVVVDIPGTPSTLLFGTNPACSAARR